jgi:hypothetical protein
MRKEVVEDTFKRLPQNLAGASEENHEQPCAG